VILRVVTLSGTDCDLTRCHAMLGTYCDILSCAAMSGADCDLCRKKKKILWRGQYIEQSRFISFFLHFIEHSITQQYCTEIDK